MVNPAGGNEEQIGQEWFVLTPSGYVCVSSGDPTPWLDPEYTAARLAVEWGTRLPQLIAALQRMGER